MSRIYGVNANRTDINKTEYLKLAGNCKENKIQGGNCPMKKSRSFIHYGKVLLIFAILMLVPFTGCKNIFVPEPPATPEAAGSGGGITVTLRLFTGSARTVMPEYTKTGSLNWKITASQGETVVEASGEYPDYTLSLPSAGSWTFTVSGNNSDGQEIFTGSVSMEITGTTTTVSIPLSPGSAMTTGTGKIILTLTVPITVEKVMYKLDPDGAFCELTSGSDNTYTLEKESISAGTHTLSLYFLDGDNTTLYMCKETVNVWGGMTSNQWINTGNSAYINDEGKFELTEDIIDEFLKTMGSMVYVDGDSGSDDSDGVGSIFAPVASVSKAVEILRKANTEANYSATIMVSGKTTIDQEIEVENGETLTVKGMGADASITNTSGRVFNITGGSVTLRENITLTGTVTDDNGGAVYVAENGTFTMNDGSKITGSSAKYKSINCNGGAVYVAGGTFTMEAGSKITGSSATGHTSSYGGAVFIYKGTFNMNGGVIGGSEEEKNTAVCGGGVYVFTDGIFNMSGNAKIQGNEATGTDESSGGGVYVGTDGEFTMSGGTISGNKADKHGGGVCVISGGTFTMSGGTIGGAGDNDSNTASDGGGVYVGTNGRFTMSDGAAIKGNTATSSGGGVYMNGSFTVSGGTIQGQDNKNEIYSCKTFTITGEPTIENCTITLEQNALINVNGLNTVAALTNVRVNPHNNNYTEGTTLLEKAGSKDICDKFALNNIPENKGIWWIGLDDNMKNGILCNISDVSGLQNLVTAAGSGGKVEITGGGDITVDTTVSVPDGANVTIKPDSGNSVNITASGATTVFDVKAGGTLTLGGENSGSVIITGDSSVVNPYKFDGDYSLITVSGGTVNIGKNTEIKDNKAGRGVNVTSGKLYMTGGKISGNTGNTNGGGVLVGGVGTTFEMSGGKICNNTLVENSPNSDPRQGGGVCVFHGAIFVLSGDAEIYGNSAQDGGAVCVKDGPSTEKKSTFNMKGGKIYDNNSGGAGAVYIRAATAIMNMTGGTITGNEATQTRFAGGIYIQDATFDGTGAKGASVTDNTAGTKKIDISMTEGATYKRGSVNVAVGP